MTPPQSILGPLFGLGAALFWGGGDFGGGMGVKRLGSTVRGALLVVLIGHLLSFCVVAPLAHAAGDAFPAGLPPKNHNICDP